MIERNLRKNILHALQVFPIHHSDRGSQYLSIRYAERLAEAGFNASVGRVGDSYDNALAETINGLYKAEVIHKNGPWKGLDDVERATLTWVEWFNHRRLLRPIGDVPPAEYEKNIGVDPIPVAIQLRQLLNERRDQHLAALRAADGHDMSALLEFVGA